MTKQKLELEEVFKSKQSSGLDQMALDRLADDLEIELENWKC